MDAGIGSAGLRAYNLLIEGNTQALQDDVVLTMKQGKVPAASQVVTDDRVGSYFEHQGHGTAVFPAASPTSVWATERPPARTTSCSSTPSATGASPAWSRSERSGLDGARAQPP